MVDLAPFTTTLHPTDLADYAASQMKVFFPDGKKEMKTARALIRDTLDRTEHCFRHVRIKGFWSKHGPRFDHLHTDQYAIFLYYLANTAHRAGETRLAAKAYALNKALHGLDAFYEVELPAIFALVHPVGTVLGRAKYSDYFCAYQNVSVGADLSMAHPVIGRGVVMYGGSRVLGTATIGDNCWIGAGASVRGTAVPNDHIAFGDRPSNGIRPTERNVIRDVFKDV